MLNISIICYRKKLFNDMNTYLFPICDVSNNVVWIEKIRARNITLAKEKLVQMLMEDYDDLPDDLNEIETILSSKGIILGELYDIEEF